MRTPLSIVLVILLAGALLGGCGNGFTRVNYETIYVGQDEHSVQKAIGKPDRKTEGLWIYEHDHPFYQAIITFEDGLVSRKEWIPSRDALPDTAPDAETN